MARLMRLKTHTAYSQISVSEHNVFEVLLINAQGTTVYKHLGAGTDRQNATEKALDVVEEQSSQYIREEV